MARSHVMTPARRAALRKAQLVSARNRRKRGVKSELKRAGRQTLSTARASGSLARRSAVKRFNSPANKAKRSKGYRRVGKGLAVGAAVVGPTAILIAHSELRGKNKRIRSETRRAAGLSGYSRKQRRHIKKTYNPARYSATFGRGHSPVRVPRSVTGSRTKALTMGPKGRATVRSRSYRARKRSKK